MENKKRTDEEIEAAREVFKTAYTSFCDALKDLGYQRPAVDAVKVDLTQKGLKNPGRVSDSIALSQDRFEYMSRTNYKVIIYSGVLNNDFGKKISAFVLIVNEKGKRVWVRQFHRVGIESFFTVLEAYAMAAKRAVDERPTSGSKRYYMHLKEKSSTEHFWSFRSDIRSFDIRYSTYQAMGEVFIDAVFRKEYYRKKYFEKYRTAKTFARDRRRTWK